MKLKNVLLVVKDTKRSFRFYHDLFGSGLVTDNDGNMLLSDGIALQEETIWRGFIGREVIPKNNCTELYFEEPDLDGFLLKLRASYPDTEFVNEPTVHSWGQKVIRFYDPDGNLIEVGTPME